jgi:hypothetical protein
MPPEHRSSQLRRPTIFHPHSGTCDCCLYLQCRWRVRPSSTPNLAPEPCYRPCLSSFEQLDCSLGGTTTASCTVTATPVSSGTSVTSTGLSGALLASQFQAVTLTDNLPVETGSAQISDGEGLRGYTSGGMSLSDVTLLTGSVQSSSIAAQTSMPLGASTASTTGGSGTSSATAASKTSTAGIPQITVNAGWAVGGVALALAVAGS